MAIAQQPTPTFLQFLSLITFFVSFVFSHPLLSVSARAQDPTTDPFYQPPAGYESTAPGTILRSRSVVTAFLGLLPDPVDAHQLLYRTTSINGSAIATSTTVFKPLIGAKKDRFVSFQTAYDSSSPQCDPSYTYQLGSSQADLITSFEFITLQAYLLKGYIVSSPDYEGPDAAFAAGRLEATCVLDSMRAVQNFKSTLGLSTSNPSIVGVGYSGGAIATGWAASLHPSYAPELNVKGWSLGGTPANLTGTNVFLDNTLFSGFLPAALDGLMKPSTYADQLNPVITPALTTKGQSALSFANAHCAIDDILNFPEQSLLSTDFSSEGAAFLNNPTLAAVLDQTVMGLNANETPSAPVLLYHAPADEIIPYANASTLYNAWCGHGASVSFTTYGSGGHATTEIISMPQVLKFVDSAFAGTLASGCSTSNEDSDSLGVFDLGLMLEPIAVGLINALAVLGRQDANVINDPSVLKKSV